MRWTAAPALLLIASACGAPDAEPPSLAPRPVEGVLDRPVQALAPVPSAEDPALAARIAELVEQAEAGNRAFAGQLPATRSAVAAAEGSAPESEAWIVAQVALSALDGERSPTTTALGALDQILAEQALSGEPAEIDALTPARERVAALFASQTQVFDALAARLSSR